MNRFSKEDNILLSQSRDIRRPLSHMLPASLTLEHIVTELSLHFNFSDIIRLLQIKIHEYIHELCVRGGGSEVQGRALVTNNIKRSLIF